MKGKHGSKYLSFCGHWGHDKRMQSQTTAALKVKLVDVTLANAEREDKIWIEMRLVQNDTHRISGLYVWLCIFDSVQIPYIQRYIL